MEDVKNFVALMDDMPDFDAVVETAPTPAKQECEIVRVNSTKDVVMHLVGKQMNEEWDMEQCIDFYLKWMAEGDRVFAERMQDKEKSREQCLKFINDEARKAIKGNAGHINDAIVYGWATHYYQESNEALGLNKKETPAPIIPKTSPAKPAKTASKGKSTDKPKTYTNPLFNSLKGGKKQAKKATSNVVVLPMAQLTKKQLKNNEDCGFLF